MNSLRRMLDVLFLLKPGQSTIDIEQICASLGYPPATAYRYVRELNTAGLLVRLPGGYALGPRVIELDLQMRESDPILAHSRDLMQELARQTGLSVLLSEFYEDVVITIHQEFGMEADPLSFGRGRRMQLFRSATSRVVLAHLPPRRLRRIYDEHAGQADVLRLGADWKAFSRNLLQVRKRGYCLSRGEIDAGQAGLAAPIFDDKQRILGSITLVGRESRLDVFNEGYLSELICGAGREVTRRIAAGNASASQS